MTSAAVIPEVPPGLDRRRLSELLSLTEGPALVTVADAVVDSRVEVVLVRPPQVGGVSTQVREPVVGERYLLADVLACQAEVRVAGTAGWAMRLGEDRVATLAQAVCEAEVVRDGPLAGAVLDLCRTTEMGRAEARQEEWARLVPSIVEFEEMP